MPDRCSKCQAVIPRAAAVCHHCQQERTHRDCYPEQYQHSLVGKRVQVRTCTGYETSGMVERVVTSRFGLVAFLDGSNTQGWLLEDCTPTP
jgi:hypothetical protein